MFQCLIIKRKFFRMRVVVPYLAPKFQIIQFHELEIYIDIFFVTWNLFG